MGRPSPTVFARRVQNAMGQLAIVCRHPDCTQGSGVERLVCVIVDAGYGGAGAISEHLATHEAARAEQVAG